MTRSILLLVAGLGLLVAGCGSSKPMRFEFVMPSGNAEVFIDEGAEYSGTTGDVYELDSNDMGKKLEFDWEGVKIYARMDVFNHTALTRMSIVRIQITNDIVDAVRDYKVVTYVVYERFREVDVRGTAGEDPQMRVYDYGDSISREALIEQASRSGEVIAVIDFGNAEYVD